MSQVGIEGDLSSSKWYAQLLYSRVLFSMCLSETFQILCLPEWCNSVMLLPESISSASVESVVIFTSFLIQITEPDSIAQILLIP